MTACNIIDQQFTRTGLTENSYKNINRVKSMLKTGKKTSMEIHNLGLLLVNLLKKKSC